MRLSRKVLCLDWDARTVRLVVARTGGSQIGLEDAHSHRLPDTLDPENPQALGEFIQQTLRRHRWHYTRVIVDIPRQKAVINRLALPPTPEHEVAAAVRFQAIKELPFPLDSAVVDHVVMKRDERGLVTEVLLAAVPLEALETVQATCAAAGLVPARIGLRPYANLVSLKHLPTLAELRVLFVDVGPTMTEIDIMAGGQLAFTRSANVSVPLGREVGTEADVPDAPADLEFSDEARESAMRELIVEITRTLQAYRATEPEAGIDRIVIGGGTGVESELVPAVQRRFELPTVLFDPTEALGVSPDEAAKLRSFSAALGLAWGLGWEGAQAIDFLAPKKPVPPQAKLKRRLMIGAITAGAVLAAAAATYVTLYVKESRALAAQKKTLKERREELARYVQIENLVEEVRDWQTEAVWPEHLLQLTESALEPGQNMLVQQMSLDARTASINMKKVLATGWHVPTEFATRLNELEQGGRRPYRATQGGYRALGQRESRFHGAVDIRVDLLELKKHLEEREKRVKAREDKLRGR